MPNNFIVVSKRRLMLKFDGFKRTLYEATSHKVMRTTENSVLNQQLNIIYVFQNFQ
jgi:hypothetical protein